MKMQTLKYAISLSLLTVLISRTSALQCLQCDSDTEPSCGFSHIITLSSPVVQCAEGVQQCYVSKITSETGDRFVRGCYNEDICSDFGCFLCLEDNCNNIQYIEEKCTSCMSDPLNNFCEWDVVSNNEPITCPDTTLERSGCYLQIKDGVYTRDCVANMDEAMYATCQSADDCKICQGENCNSKEEFQRCYTCDSEKDENCVYRPDGRFIQNCQQYDDKCLAFAVADGKTARGCSQEVDTLSTFCPGTNCLECTGVECNSQLVPSYRIICYQCTADQFGCEMDQGMFKSYQRACNNFNFQDQCFTYRGENDENFVRGCMSDRSPQSELCAADPENCTVCANDLCNSAPAVPEPEPELECFQCTENDIDCELATSQAIKCEISDPTATCYYSKLTSGKIQMGCTLDDEEFCSTVDCHTCSGDKCNEQYFPRSSELLCHQCAEEEACPWRQKEAEQPVTCQSKVFYGQTDSCYYFKYENGDVRRGCSLDDAAFCTDHECKSCEGNYCNSEAEQQSCFQCTSEQEIFATCGEDVSDLNAMPCATDAFYEEAGCYSLKTEDGVVIRGCWNDAAEEHKTFCATEDAPCHHCIGIGCNNDDHSGSGNLVVALPLIVLAALVTLLIQL